MVKPGLQRAIPAAIIGFSVGAILVLLLRTAQQMDPIWDPGVALVVIPFTITGFFLWGMGAFDPRMSAHGEAHGAHDENAIIQPPATQAADVSDSELILAEQAIDDAEHGEYTQDGPFAVFTNQIWLTATLSIIIFIVVFAFALAPTGLFLQQTASPAANAGAIEPNETFALPFGSGEFQASQLTVFAGFVAFTLISLFLFGGLLAALFTGLNRGVMRAEATDAAVATAHTPAPIRWTGRQLRSVARGLRRGIPRFFGYKN